MEEKNLFNDVLETEVTEKLDEGVEDVTETADEDCENCDIATYDDYDDGESVEDESEGNLGKVLIVGGGMLLSAAAGAYLAPKAKKVGAKVKNCVKNKFSKKEPEEVIIEEESN